MSEWGGLIALGIGLALLLALAWWLLIASEGVYLGRRVVIWLYDLYAHRYNDVKDYYPEYEQLYLAEPFLDALAPQVNPLVLDVATGTGRLPLALSLHPDFRGFTIGVDLSRQMLHHAINTLHPHEERAAFIHAPAENLPFPDHTFDAVTCLEALEFMVNPQAVLAELVRVLRPGGLLLITQRINTRLLPGKAWDEAQMLAALEACGVVNSDIEVWQMDYHKVWGTKAGASDPVGARPATAVTRCPRCATVAWQIHGDEWLCETCKATYPVGSDGVLEFMPPA
jgi:ubiquinone/menaquinone biosynthesis C-methylase UbiE